MPQKAWTAKRERQYNHIKEGLMKGGSSEKKAEEIAARTVNKERARAGETKKSPAYPEPTSRHHGAEAFDRIQGQLARRAPNSTKRPGA